MSTPVLLLITVLLAYSVLPTIVIRLSRFGAVSRLPRGDGRVALTFDDGPDPVYTPQILEILKRYGARACFFVVGNKAGQYPEVIRQIVQEGHLLGNHGFRHKPALFLGPAATVREIRETNLLLEQLTGQKTRYCRPAWGLFNLFALWYCWIKGLKVILWTYMSWDWCRGTTPENITRKALGRIKDGTILIFHDSDSTPGAAAGGPARVAAALPEILAGLEERKLSVVPLEEIIQMRKGTFKFKKILQRLWTGIEFVIRRASGIQELGEGDAAIWRVARRTYHGPDWRMPDGSILSSGDHYLELHLNSDRVLSLVDETMSMERMAIAVMREVRKGLPYVTAVLKNNPRFRGIEIVMGISLLHKGTERIGFKAYDMKPGLFRLITGWYEKFLLVLYHPGGLQNLRSYRDQLIPKYVVITKQDLLRRYPPPGQPVVSEGESDPSS